MCNKAIAEFREDRNIVDNIMFARTLLYIIFQFALPNAICILHFYHKNHVWSSKEFMKFCSFNKTIIIQCYKL